MADTGVVGVQQLSAGATGNLRLDKTGGLVGNDTYGRHAEAALNSQLFILDSDAVTLAAANTTKTAMATAKFINGFYNPVGSGKNAIILWANVSVTSGTPTGPFVWNYLTGLTISSASTGTIRPGLLGASSSSAMVPQVGVVLAAVGGPTTALSQLATLGGPAAIAAASANLGQVEETQGRIIVPPGSILGLMQIGASTALVQSTIIWVELPI